LGLYQQLPENKKKNNKERDRNMMKQLQAQDMLQYKYLIKSLKSE
jgi:hypothetical protein